MEKLQKLMNAIIEQNTSKSEKFYLNTIKTNIEEILHVSDDSSCIDNYVFAFKGILAAAFMNGITADQLFHMATIHTPIDNHNTLPSRINTKYDSQLFTASCAALTGLISSSDSREVCDDDVQAHIAISIAKSLINMLNKE